MVFWHYSFEEAREIIDDRAAKGFTAILALVSHGNLPNRYGHAPFEDRTTLEVADEYFAQADRVLDYASSKGLAVYAGALWWYRSDTTCADPCSSGVWARVGSQERSC